jgi:hypothetical protein
MNDKIVLAHNFAASFVGNVLAAVIATFLRKRNKSVKYIDSAVPPVPPTRVLGFNLGRSAQFRPKSLFPASTNTLVSKSGHRLTAKVPQPSTRQEVEAKLALAKYKLASKNSRSRIESSNFNGVVLQRK